MERQSSKEHLRYRYGICLNDQCPKCKSKEVQTILARKDFVCGQCGKALRECPPPVSFWRKYGKWIIIAGVIVAVAAAVYIAIALGSRGGEAKEQPGKDTTIVTPPDTVTPNPHESATDTVKGIGTESKKTKEKEKKKQREKVVVTTPPPSVRVPYGRYEGPANGLGGTIYVSRSYSLDLNDGSGECLWLEPGDQIQNTKFKGGRLCGGVWVHDGSRRAFNR